MHTTAAQAFVALLALTPTVTAIGTALGFGSGMFITLTPDTV